MADTKRKPGVIYDKKGNPRRRILPMLPPIPVALAEPKKPPMSKRRKRMEERRRNKKVFLLEQAYLNFYQVESPTNRERLDKAIRAAESEGIDWKAVGQRLSNEEAKRVVTEGASPRLARAEPFDVSTPTPSGLQVESTGSGYMESKEGEVGESTDRKKIPVDKETQRKIDELRREVLKKDSDENRFTSLGETWNRFSEQNSKIGDEEIVHTSPINDPNKMDILAADNPVTMVFDVIGLAGIVKVLGKGSYKLAKRLIEDPASIRTLPKEALDKLTSVAKAIKNFKQTDADVATSGRPIDRLSDIGEYTNPRGNRPKIEARVKELGERPKSSSERPKWQQDTYDGMSKEQKTEFGKWMSRRGGKVPSDAAIENKLRQMSSSSTSKPVTSPELQPEVAVKPQKQKAPQKQGDKPVANPGVIFKLLQKFGYTTKQINKFPEMTEGQVKLVREMADKFKGTNPEFKAKLNSLKRTKAFENAGKAKTADQKKLAKIKAEGANTGVEPAVKPKPKAGPEKPKVEPRAGTEKPAVLDPRKLNQVGGPPKTAAADAADAKRAADAAADAKKNAGKLEDAKGEYGTKQQPRRAKFPGEDEFGRNTPEVEAATKAQYAKMEKHFNNKYGRKPKKGETISTGGKVMIFGGAGIGAIYAATEFNKREAKLKKIDIVQDAKDTEALTGQGDDQGKPKFRLTPLKKKGKGTGISRRGPRHLEDARKPASAKSPRKFPKPKPRPNPPSSSGPNESSSAQASRLGGDLPGDGMTNAERQAIKDGQPMTSTQAANVAKDKNIDLGTKAGKKWFQKVTGKSNLDVEYEDMSDAGPGADEIAWSKKMEKTFVNKGGSVKKKPFGYNKGGSAKKSYGMRKGGFTSRGGMYS